MEETSALACFACRSFFMYSFTEPEAFYLKILFGRQQISMAGMLHLEVIV